MVRAQVPPQRRRLELRQVDELVQYGPREPVQAREREVGLRLHAGGPEHRHRLGAPGGVFEQRALADPGLAPDDERSTLAARGTLEQPVDRGTLALTADERGRCLVNVPGAHRADRRTASRPRTGEGDRRTGHNAAPFDDLSDTILLKTERMRRVRIDPGSRVARVEAGVLSLELVQAAAEHGLATLAGPSPDVGVIDYTLGGGMSWLGRKYGLAASNVTAAKLVTADGRVVRADRESEPDLFWALRGGGGNFGIVTAF
jgi:hypothetical protein